MRKLSEELKRDILRLELEGHSAYTIANRLRMSRGTVRWVLERWGKMRGEPYGYGGEDEPSQEEVDRCVREQLSCLPPWWKDETHEQRGTEEESHYFGIVFHVMYPRGRRVMKSRVNMDLGGRTF